MKYRSLIPLAISLAVLTACSSSKSSSSVGSKVNPLLRIEALPPADAQQVSTVRDMKNWKNPYLIVRVDGVGLLDSANNEQRILTTDQLLAALADLPTSAWPYGRIVAVTESAATRSSEADKAQLRKNRALVAGTLENLQVVINWVPST
ncbi:MAG: hypothetical protein ACLPOO_14490 [Terriglobales bacterium]